jgi:hypothetical protein
MSPDAAKTWITVVLFASTVLTLALLCAIWLITMFRHHLSHRTPLEPLEPGRCECGHRRSSHDKGRGVCLVTHTDRECACCVYIKASDPLTQELEKLYKRS